MYPFLILLQLDMTKYLQDIKSDIRTHQTRYVQPPHLVLKLFVLSARGINSKYNINKYRF